MPRYEAEVTISTSVIVHVEAKNKQEAARMFESDQWDLDPKQNHALMSVTPYWDTGNVHEFWKAGGKKHFSVEEEA